MALNYNGTRYSKDIERLRLIDRSATVRVQQVESLSDQLFRQALYNAPKEKLRIIAAFYSLAKTIKS
jgi:hypothetical protein